MHHVREGKHGARSPEQAIALAYQKRGVRRRLGPPKSGKVSEETATKREVGLEKWQSPRENLRPSALGLLDRP
jgi:hypothetical protein